MRRTGIAFAARAGLAAGRGAEAQDIRLFGDARYVRDFARKNRADFGIRMSF